MRFFVFWLVRFLENGPKEKILGNCRGSFTAAKGPLAVAKSFDAVLPRRGFFLPRVHSDEAELRRGEATIHNMEMLCFCLVLFFRCSENMYIGLMRTL